MTDSTGAAEAIAFLQWLDPDGWHNLVSIDPKTGAIEAKTFRPGDWKGVAAWLKPRIGKTNLFFHVNEPAPDSPDSKLPRSAIAFVRACFVDLDQVPEGYPWGDPIEDYPPSAIVQSGNGQWGFWKLTDKIPADVTFEQQNKALAKRFGGDPASTDLCRIARLPGTVNIPTAAKRAKGKTEQRATVGRLSPATYTQTELAAWIEPKDDAPSSSLPAQAPLIDLDLPESVTDATAWLLEEAPEAIEGAGGDAATYGVAARLKDFGISQRIAFDMMLRWNERKAIPPWGASELQQKVSNAYAYGTALPGRDSRALAEVEFGPAEVDGASSSASRAMSLQFVADVTEDLKAKPHWLIEDLYDRNAMIVTYGESNSGKTHVVLDQAFAVASGRTWAAKRVHPGLVVYVAAEGGRGLKRRIMAHKAKYGAAAENAPLAVVNYPIDLRSSMKDAKALVGLVKDTEAKAGASCVMVVIDTLSRALAGGDENSSTDMGSLVKVCDHIRFATGAALHLVHHSGKDKAKGARGHSLLRAATDTEIEVANNAITVTKQRDMAFCDGLRFRYEEIGLGVNLEGNPVKSVVLDVWKPTEFTLELTEAQNLVWDAAIAINATLNDGKTGDESRNFLPTLAFIVALKGRLNEGTVKESLKVLADFGVLFKPKHGKYILLQSRKVGSKSSSENDDRACKVGKSPVYTKLHRRRLRPTPDFG